MCRDQITPAAQDRFLSVTRSTVFVVVTSLLSSCVVESEPVGPTPGSPVFEGAVAMGHVQTQVDFGPRIPGTEGHEAQLSWML